MPGIASSSLSSTTINHVDNDFAVTHDERDLRRPPHWCQNDLDSPPLRRAYTSSSPSRSPRSYVSNGKYDIDFSKRDPFSAATIRS
ncbi:hypothetical protein PILCRDRAFT_7311 [Piloderma croceum F 1598]|uniref:Uncharacterized protein n=1 Tax=Piloderma croceum (strain F 1598) TaxID=765440 RepID=A0A0C3FG49_PILCF|nr:hypothetical protein PILCRDRAFT_7311 [Piloderma croceum F 1598]